MSSPSLEHLLSIMAKLRDPKTGCAWDRQQSFDTIAPYTIEEAYEVAEAIAARDFHALRDELGDLLFQVVFHARMAEELGAFNFDDVAAAICSKMIRRHPHIFTDQAERTAQEQVQAWEAVKAAERKAKGETKVLDGIAVSLPALSRALKLQARAATVGFDWSEASQVLDKISEEISELGTEIEAGADEDRLEDEMGDILFACANLARKLGLDPEQALRRTNAKFIHRFGHIEQSLAAKGRTPAQASLEEMEYYWQDAKKSETDKGR